MQIDAKPALFLTVPRHCLQSWESTKRVVSHTPPKFNAQLFSVGRFHLCFPHDTQGSRTFCVCDRGSMVWLEHPRLPSVPPSLLSKSALTSSPWHTHMAFYDHDLRACHCHSLSGGLGAAIHHANTAAAQGMEYKPALLHDNECSVGRQSSLVLRLARALRLDLE